MSLLELLRLQYYYSITTADTAGIWFWGFSLFLLKSEVEMKIIIQLNALTKNSLKYWTKLVALAMQSFKFTGIHSVYRPDFILYRFEGLKKL